MNAKTSLGRALCYAVAFALTLLLQRSAASAGSSPQIRDVRCSDVELSLSPSGERLLVRHAQTSKRAFVSTEPFVPNPQYQLVGVFPFEQFWSGDDRVVGRRHDGHVVWDVSERKGKFVRYEEPGRMFPRVSHGIDVFPRFVDAAYFALSDGFSRNVRAVEIETGRTRLVLEGSPGDTYTDFVYIGSHGREIARISRARDGADGQFAFADGQARVPLRPGDKIEPLFTAESAALSNKGLLLALRTSKAGHRELVAFDPAAANVHVLRALGDERLVGVGVSSDGERLEWISHDGQPSTTFFKDAPRALVEFVAQFPGARLAFESQSADGQGRLFKLTERSGGTHFYRLTATGGQEFAVPCRRLPKAS